MKAREYLEQIRCTPDEIDDWLKDRVFRYDKYDPELGWVFRDALVKHGTDDSVSVYNFDGSGARRMMMHADQPCRINCYGDSMTGCDQVNDGETWEEMLAAHLCEPVRNYGIGGYSVYQSYRRMLREEKHTPAEYILFGIFTDFKYGKAGIDGISIKNSGHALAKDDTDFMGYRCYQ